VDLDRVKTVSGTDSFRRMFFIDEETNGKVFVVNGFHNLTKQGEILCSPPRTVYLKVSLTQCIYPRFFIKNLEVFLPGKWKDDLIEFFVVLRRKRTVLEMWLRPFHSISSLVW